jgi:hypothetical protein
MRSPIRVAVVALIIAAVGAGAFLWWRQRRPPPAAPPIAPVVSRAAPPIAAVPPAPAIRYPIGRGAARPPGALPPRDQADAYVKGALVDLLGRKAVLSFLNVDGFARRFVATVDNLGREHASSDLWPVNRTAGRIDTEAGADGPVISARNGERYAGLVGLIEAVGTRPAVALYLRLYPLFQQAYEDLGYPGKYFNDRVVEVIDDLLATPDLAGPIKVKRIEVEGAVKPAAQPEPASGLYVFADPTLEARSAGQRILLRIGRDNAAKIKAKLGDVRRQIIESAAAR